MWEGYVHKYQLHAKVMKAGISDDQLAALVVSLRDDDKLCITEDHVTHDKQPQIICSMGLKNV
jgi:hypothetical protein